MVLFGQKMLYWDKRGCIGEKTGCIWAKVVIIGKSGCIRAKWLYSVKSGLIRSKVVVFPQT